MLNNNVSVSTLVRSATWKNDGTNFVRLRVSAKGVTRYIKTPIIVQRTDMGTDGNIVVPALRRAAEDYLRKVEVKISKLTNAQLSQMNVDEAVAYIMQDEAANMDFIAFYREYIEDKRMHSKNTYNSALNAFISFLERDSLPISEIDIPLLRKWEAWLRKKYGDGARSVSAYFACISTVHAQARMEYNNEDTGEIVIQNPFKNYPVPRQRASAVGHRDLDVHIIQKMMDLRTELEGRERFGVDVFLISFALMGMNCPDLYTCEWDDGNVIRYNRTKTRDRRDDRAEMMVLVDPLVEGILSEYYSRDRDSNRVFDFDERYTSYEIMGENVNAGLKQFAKRINYPKAITLYCARHSWASIAYKTGVQRSVICDGLGHKNRENRICDIYIHREWKQVWEMNHKVLETLRWSDK